MRSSIISECKRIGNGEPLVTEQGIGHPPAVVEFADQVFGGHHDIVEEYLAEFVVAGDGLDRPHAHARAVQVDQKETDAGLPWLRLRIGAHQREHPVRMVRPGLPDLLPAHGRSERSLSVATGGEAGEVGGPAPGSE